MNNENTNLQLDREFRDLITFGKTEIDLRSACGQFVTFMLQGHKVVSSHQGITASNIREYFQSKMETE